NVTGDLRRDGSHVCSHIGVVGRDQETAVGPVFVPVPGTAAGKGQQEDRQYEGAGRAFLLLGRRLRYGRRRGGGVSWRGLDGRRRLVRFRGGFYVRERMNLGIRLVSVRAKRRGGLC